MAYQLKLKMAYNIAMYAPAILGTGYDNAVVLAILDYDTAKLYQSNLVSLHKAVLPYLPAATSQLASDLTYVRIKTVSGDYRVIAMEWISSQPTVVSTKTIQITVTDVEQDDIAIIGDMLSKRGYTNYTINTLQST